MKRLSVCLLSLMLALGMAPCALAEEVISGVGDEKTPAVETQPDDALDEPTVPAATEGNDVVDAVSEGNDVVDTVSDSDDLVDDALDAAIAAPEMEPTAPVVSASAVKPTVSTAVHVQNDGWKAPVVSNAVDSVNLGTSAFAGTVGRSLRVEAFRIQLGLEGTGLSGGVSYNTHIQNIGWQGEEYGTSGWFADGQMAGTEGRSLRCEAIQIRLVGEVADAYDVYYRVHVQDYGWLDWTSDGAAAGSAGRSKRMEAVQVVLVAKDSAGVSVAPGATDTPYVRDMVTYSAHVQNVGWQGVVADGRVAGTSGRSLRVEAFTMSLGDVGCDGGIRYRTHVQNVGWQGWVANGQSAGTTGLSLRLEALQVELTGDAADAYDVYYRVHVQDIGWMDWAKNGAQAGTAALSYRMEAAQVVLVTKGADAPGATAHPYYEGPSLYEAGGVQAIGYVEGLGETALIDAGKTVGNDGGGANLQGLSLRLSDTSSKAFPGGIEYRLYVSSIGWTDWLNTSSLKNGVNFFPEKHIEAVQVRLIGTIANHCSVYYRSCIAGTGWLGWASNGVAAGSVGQSKGIEALQIKIVANSEGSPGSTSTPFALSSNMALNKRIGQILQSNGTLEAAYGYLTNNFSWREMGVWPSYPGWQEAYALELLNVGSGNCYSFASALYFCAKGLGYDAAIVSGEVLQGDGSWGPHGWLELYKNGKVYVCDPDAGVEIPGINFYMIQYSNAPLTYRH